MTYPSAGEAVRKQLLFIIELLEELQENSSIPMKLRTALLNCFSNVAWSNENGQAYYNSLKEALELIKTMSPLQDGIQMTIKLNNIYSDMGSSPLGSGNGYGHVFVSDIFKEDATVKVTLIPSVTCWNPSYLGITKADEWGAVTTTNSTAYLYNAIALGTMTIDMEYTETIYVKAGYQVAFFIGGVNESEPKIEVVGEV